MTFQIKKLRFIFVFFLSTTFSYGQNLFDINTVRNIDIHFYDSDWDSILDSLATANVGTGSGTGRILADVIIDGIQFDSCGVRYKGNSSMDTASNKNPFNIDLNYTIAGQEYLGKDKIKLANCFTDPSMVREALTYEIANQYMDAPQGSFVKLYINGSYRGVYTNTESVDNEFLDEYYGSSNNPFFKCDPVSFQIYGDNSNLAFHPDTASYDTLYDMKSDYGLTELQDLCFQLEYNASNIDQYLDVDRALWFLAISSALVHNDGYTAFAHNYYLYKMDNGKWSIVLWDVNMSFGGLLWNGTNLLPLGLQALQEQSPFLHENALNYRPLIAKLLTQPEIKKKYIAHYNTIIEENLDNNHYYTRAQFMQNLIDADVQNEPYNPYSYNDFTNNLDNDVGFWFDLRPGLSNLMNPRTTYLNNLPEFQLVAPSISSVSPINNQPLPNTSVDIIANTTLANNCDLYYRHNHFDAFIKTPMFDDGAHSDGAANDGVFGTSVLVQDTDLEYYVYASNTDAGKFSPVRAAYEYYILSPLKGVVINEFLASNVTVEADTDGEFDDWIELYNNSTGTIDLSGYYLSDDPNDATKWMIPAGTSIGGNDYIIVWADKDSLQAGLHSNFKLSAAGETLLFSHSNGQLLDSVSFGQQQVDVAFGRLPNGIGSFTFLQPTFSAYNEKEVYLNMSESSVNNFEIYPNPAHEFVMVTVGSMGNENIEVYTTDGKTVLVKVIEGFETEINTIELTSGIYFIKIGEITRKLIVK